MPFSLEQIVPWGRSFAEYRGMFALTEEDLKSRILSCADGPASFNAQATGLGADVVSIDPLYEFSGEEIQQRIDVTYPQIMAQVRENQSAFVWKEFESAEALGRSRMASMERFLNDFDMGRECGRYLPAELPSLPFENGSFDLALCSHFLFLYSDQLSIEFHVDSILDMCRVAGEVRIFPLLALDGSPSLHVTPVISALRSEGLRVESLEVAYEFQRGGNRMLRVQSPTK